MSGKSFNKDLEQLQEETSNSKENAISVKDITEKYLSHNSPTGESSFSKDIANSYIGLTKNPLEILQEKTAASMSALTLSLGPRSSSSSLTRTPSSSLLNCSALFASSPSLSALQRETDALKPCPILPPMSYPMTLEDYKGYIQRGTKDFTDIVYKLFSSYKCPCSNFRKLQAIPTFEMTSLYPLDTGTTELDKLIHSFEFENQQYVKMIEKENQLIILLESQIQEKIQESLRLEEEVSRFDEDTKRLHRLYTNNRDNIENLKNTIDVLSDHEVAISRQLEVTRAKTEENRKFYKTHIANYSSINEDYMKKYMKFPLANELEKKRIDLGADQRKLDEVKAQKQHLKDEITTKEDELDSKVMTRIMVKIARTKLKTYQLEKEIHECLAEKTDLVEKLKDIRTSKQPEQGEQSTQDYNSNIDKQSMETGDIASEHIDGCEGHKSSDDVEEFSNMCITEDNQRSLTDNTLDGAQCYSADEPSVNNTEARHFPGTMHSEMNVDTGNVWSILAPEEENIQQTFTTSDLPSEDGDQYSTPASYLHKRNVIAIKQLSTASNIQTCGPLTAMAITEPLQRTRSEDPISSPFISTVSNTTALLPSRSAVSVTPLNRMVVSQKPGQQFIQTTNSPDAIDNTKAQIPPSLHFPRLSVPKPPRVPPPPVVKIPPKLPEHCNPPPSYAEIKRPKVPPFSMLKDFRQKLNLCFPRLPVPSLHQFSTLTKTPALTSTMTEESLVDPDEGHHKFNSSETSQFQTSLSSFSSGMMSSTQAHASLQLSRRLVSSNEESATGKQTTTPEGTSRVQTKSTEHSVTTLTEQINDLEIPLAECDDNPPVKASKCQTVFKMNMKGSHSPSAGTKSPKGNYSKSPTREKGSASQGNHSFLFESLFGNFGKNSNEDNTEDEEAAPTSIFSLFNVSQNTASRNTGDDSSDAGTFFTLGKFTDETGSPSSDGGPCNLLNLFTKSQNSEISNHEFAINLQEDRHQEDGGGTFKLGDGDKESYFSYGQRCGSDEEGDKPLFNLF